MPGTSIIIKAEDRYSSALKNMSNVTKTFDKESEHLEGTLQATRRRSWRTAEAGSEAQRAVQLPGRGIQTYNSDGKRAVYEKFAKGADTMSSKKLTIGGIPFASAEWGVENGTYKLVFSQAEACPCKTRRIPR